METPDKIYLHGYDFSDKPVKSWSERPVNGMKGHEATNVEYICKDALIEYLQKEMERLWEIIPDASNDAPTQMEMRYLGEYMATERLIDEIKEL